MFDTGRVSDPQKMSALESLRTGLRSAGSETIRNRTVHPQLRPLFPQGLTAGVHTLDGPLTVGLGLLSGSDWAGVVGFPDLGAEAIVEWGIEPQKLVLIPEVGAAWVEVVAELAEVTETILTCAPPPVTDAIAGRLLSRLRHRNTAMIVCGGWSRPQSRIRARIEGWGGLGQGHGYLTHQRLRIEVTERHHTRQHRIIRGHEPFTELSLAVVPDESRADETTGHEAFEHDSSGIGELDQPWAS